MAKMEVPPRKLVGLAAGAVLSLASRLPVGALQNGLAVTPPRGFSTWQQWPDQGRALTQRSLLRHGVACFCRNGRVLSDR